MLAGTQWISICSIIFSQYYYQHTSEQFSHQRGKCFPKGAPGSPGEPQEWGSRDCCDYHKDKPQIKHGNTSDIKMYIFIAGRIISSEGLAVQVPVAGTPAVPLASTSHTFGQILGIRSSSLIPSHGAWSTTRVLSSASSAFSCSKGSLEWLGSALESSRQGREEMHSAISACTFCRSRIYFS